MPLPVVASACSIFLLPNLPPTVSMLGYTGLRVTVSGWMPLLLVVKVTCIVLCCSKGSDSLTGTSHMLISIDDFKDLKRPFFISTVPLQPLMAYNCAEVGHFCSKHWKQKKEKTMQSSQKTKLLQIYCFYRVTEYYCIILTYRGHHWFCQTVFWSLSPSLLLCDKQKNI